MRFGKKIIIFALVMLAFSGACSLRAEDLDLTKLKKDQQIIVDGDKVEFFEKESKIVAEGNVSIKYGDVKLTCDYIEVNTETQVAACRGNVRIESPDGTLTGDNIIYDFRKQKGEIVGAEVKAFPWFAQAEDTKRVSEKEFFLKKGYITTCDYDHPHYRIAADEIRIFPDEKVMAKNVIIYIGDIPVMWLPYYYQPIIQSRAKVQFIPGQSSDWGYFLLSSWRFYVKGNTKVDLLLDYRTKKGLAEGANLYYYAEDFGMPTLGEGTFRSYFIQENGRMTYDPTPFRGDDAEEDNRQRFQWLHRIDFDPNTVGMIEFNKLSDEYLIKDYFYNEYEQNDVIPQNYMSIVSAQQNFFLSLDYEQRFNDFYTTVEKLPEVKLDVPAQRLWETPFYYSSEMSGTIFEKEYAYDLQEHEDVKRFDTFHKLSYVEKLGFLNITPYGAFRETFYSRNKWQETDFLPRTAVGGGVDLSTRFHRIYDVQTDALGLDINGMRHIIAPHAEYFHLHQPTVDKSNLYQMDYIDALEKENGVRLYLENKIQVKRHSGDKLYTVDFVRFLVETDYLFRMAKNEFELAEDGKFTDIFLDLEMSPYRWLYIDTEATVSPKNQAFKTGQVEVAFHPWEDLRCAAGYRYEKIYPDSRNLLTFDLNYRINPQWAIGVYERIDVHSGQAEEQQLSIIRDLHCWEVEVSYNLKGSNFLKDEHTFWIAFKIKAFPDLPIGLDRSFDRRPAGSLDR